MIEQWAAINSASEIVALHGAGMANLFFHKKPRQTSVIEITPINYINPCFAYAAEEAGMSYYCLAGSPLVDGSFAVSLAHIAAFLDNNKQQRPITSLTASVISS